MSAPAQTNLFSFFAAKPNPDKKSDIKSLNNSKVELPGKADDKFKRLPEKPASVSVEKPGAKNAAISQQGKSTSTSGKKKTESVEQTKTLDPPASEVVPEKPVNKKGKPGSSTRDMSRTIGKGASKTLDSIERGIGDLLDGKPEPSSVDAKPTSSTTGVGQVSSQPLTNKSQQAFELDDIDGMFENSEKTDHVSKPEPVVSSSSQKLGKQSVSLERERITSAEKDKSMVPAAAAQAKTGAETRRGTVTSRKAGMEIMEDSLPTPNRRRANEVQNTTKTLPTKSNVIDPYKEAEEQPPAAASGPKFQVKRVSPAAARVKENVKPAAAVQPESIEKEQVPIKSIIQAEPESAKPQKETKGPKSKNPNLHNTVVAPLFTPEQAEKIAQDEVVNTIAQQSEIAEKQTARSKDKKSRKKGGKDSQGTSPNTVTNPSRPETESAANSAQNKPAIGNSSGQLQDPNSRANVPKENPSFREVMNDATDAALEKFQQLEESRTKHSSVEQGADLVRTIEEEIKNGVKNNLPKRDYKREAMKELGLIYSQANSPEEKPVTKVKLNQPTVESLESGVPKISSSSQWSQIFKPTQKELEQNQRNVPELGDGKIPLSSLRIGTWNINGIRACSSKGLVPFIKSSNLDILCFNEMKIDEVDFYSEKHQEIFPKEYFQYWNFCNSKKGYSGTGIISKFKPKSVFKGLGDPRLDDEGRLMTLEFEDFYLVACYVPNASQFLRRLTFRTKEWDPALLKYINTLRGTKPTILLGDLNVAPGDIDTCDPRRVKDIAGVTLEERANFKAMLDQGWVDSFRHLHGGMPAFSFFNYSTKGNNKRKGGLRLDFILAGIEDVSAIRDVSILEEVGGSDHVPVTGIIDIDRWRKYAHKRRVVWGSKAEQSSGKEDGKGRHRSKGEMGQYSSQQDVRQVKDGRGEKEVKRGNESGRGYGGQENGQSGSRYYSGGDQGGLRSSELSKVGSRQESMSESGYVRQSQNWSRGASGSQEGERYRRQEESGRSVQREREGKKGVGMSGGQVEEVGEINLIDKMNAHLQQASGKTKPVYRK